MVYGKEMIMGFLHGRWWCNHRENVVLRDYPSPLWTRDDCVEPVFTESEVRTQLVIAALGSGGLLLTDPMPELQRIPDRFRYISQILPVWPEACRIVDTFPDARYPSVCAVTVRRPFETWAVAGVINWSDATRDFHLPLSVLLPEIAAETPCRVFSYFDRRLLGTFDRVVPVPGVPAHGAALLAVRVALNRPQLVSTNLHFLQGAVDIDDVTWDEAACRLVVRIGHFVQRRARVYLAAPDGWRFCSLETDAEAYCVDALDPPLVSVLFHGNACGKTAMSLSWENGTGIFSEGNR